MTENQNPNPNPTPVPVFPNPLDLFPGAKTYTVALGSLFGALYFWSIGDTNQALHLGLLGLGLLFARRAVDR